MIEEKEESNESEDQESEEDGEMACTGGCKGKWSRYRFTELDYKDDSLAEDGLWHTYAFPSLYYHYVCAVFTVCPQVLFNVYNVTTGRTTGVWGEPLYTMKTIRQFGPVGSVW